MVKLLPKSKKKSLPTNRFSLYKNSLVYRKLPDQLIKLSVLKLDGSSFSFHVERDATVGRLKSAIQEEFSLIPMDEREKLWSLVWSHFSLCYEDQKLIHDTASILKYGIKDGDQLQFLQHLRMDLPPSPKNLSSDSRHCSVTSVHDARSNHRKNDYVNLEQLDCGEESVFPQRRSRLSYSLKEILPCSRFQHSNRHD